MTKTHNAVTKNKQITKSDKVTVKQLQQAENNYILINNDLVHKIISQDFSGRSLNSKDKKEREQYIDKLNNEVVTLNTLYAKYAYEKVIALLKKSKTDGIQITCFSEDEDEQSIIMEYDYVLEDGIVEDEIKYVHAEDNDMIEEFFAELPEFLDGIFIELSRKVLTDDGSIYFFKKTTFEEFLTYFDIHVAIGYNIEVNLEELQEDK